jgi:putative membrane protein
MKRLTQLFTALVMAAAVAACANDGVRNDSATGATGTTGTAGTSADVDRDWVNEQLADGDAEVRLGRLAQERAASADVRAFGGTMVEDHTMAGTELKRIATSHNVAPSADDRDDHDDLFDRLSTLTGAEFDRAYMDAMVDDHDKTVDALEDKAGDDDEHADVKNWATKTLPTVKEHLQRAKDIRARLGNSM